MQFIFAWNTFVVILFRTKG